MNEACFLIAFLVQVVATVFQKSFALQVPDRKSNLARRADLCLPDMLCIKESRIPEAGSGVWTISSVPKNARFGPYEGALTNCIDAAHVSGYSWAVSA